MVWHETQPANNKWLSLLKRSTIQIAYWAANEWRFRRLHQKYKSYTMIPERLYAGNLHLAAGIAGIEGAVVECGTWRGGMIAGIADVLGSGRRYYLCDSFEGLPPPGKLTAREPRRGRPTQPALNTLIIAPPRMRKPAQRCQCLLRLIIELSKAGSTKHWPGLLQGQSPCSGSTQTGTIPQNVF
jgi:hypothetical protein